MRVGLPAKLRRRREPDWAFEREVVVADGHQNVDVELRLVEGGSLPLARLECWPLPAGGMRVRVYAAAHDEPVPVTLLPRGGR